MPSGYWLKCDRCEREHVTRINLWAFEEGIEGALNIAGWTRTVVGLLCEQCTNDFRKWIKENVQ